MKGEGEVGYGQKETEMKVMLGMRERAEVKRNRGERGVSEGKRELKQRVSL